MSKQRLSLIVIFLCFFSLQTAIAAVNVIAEDVKKGNISKILRFSGETIPYVEAWAAADVFGPVAEIYVEDGDRVEKGQPLAKIDDVRFKIALRMAQASLEIAEQKLEEEKRDFERNETLFKKGAITRKTFDMVETSYIQAKVNVKQSRAELDKAELDLNRCVIRAPIKGFFVDRSIDLGQAMARGQNMGKIIFLDIIYVEAKIAEQDINKIDVGQECLINGNFKGKVAHINLSADSSRAFEIKIKVNNPDVYYKDKMFIKGSIILKDYKDVPMFPSQAIRNNRGEIFVFAVEDGIARRITIDIIAQQGEETYAEQVKAGMKIVTVGQDNLDDGSEITLRNSKIQ
ncbi:MAG: efflux RND transporter periplasmic adaptor subunit [Candidatus Rifleibacteriota bacterium]